MSVLLHKDWYCPNCTESARTFDAKLPHHVCQKVGLMIPLLQVGVHSGLELREREDMIGDEVVTYSAQGRPIMSAVVTTDDTQACTVFAPLAVGSIRGED